MGTDGLEFVEYAAPDAEALGALFERMGFAAVGKHRSKEVVLYRQGDINLIVNADRDSFAQSYANLRTPKISAIAIRVKDAVAAHKRALGLGAWEVETNAGVMELHIPAFEGIGDSLLYLVDRYGDRSIYDVDFMAIPGAPRKPVGAGLTAIDHVTHRVQTGRVRQWSDFYARLFGFREESAPVRPDAQRTLRSPCGKIRFELEAFSDFPPEGDGADVAAQHEGIDHVALRTADLNAAVSRLEADGVRFQTAAKDEDSSAGGTRRRATQPELGSVAFEIVERKDA